MELILNDYEGIRVPRNAIRFDKDNQKGVYILLGQRIAFKKIETIYECEEYILSKATSDTSYVSIYDDIITEGEISEDLYVEETEPEENEDPPPEETDINEDITEKVSQTEQETDAEEIGENEDDEIWE